MPDIKTQGREGKCSLFLIIVFPVFPLVFKHLTLKCWISSKHLAFRFFFCEHYSPPLLKKDASDRSRCLPVDTQILLKTRSHAQPGHMIYDTGQDGYCRYGDLPLFIYLFLILFYFSK